MSTGSLIIGIVAIIISIASLFFSYRSSSASEKSANAAKISAKQAMLANHIARADILRPHTTIIIDFLNFLTTKKTSTTSEKLKEVRKSIIELRTLVSSYDGIIELLDIIDHWLRVDFGDTIKTFDKAAKPTFAKPDKFVENNHDAIGRVKSEFQEVTGKLLNLK